MAESPAASSPEVSRRFSSHPRRDTLPELALRRLLHGMGLRYRVDVRPEPSLRRRADIVFTKAKLAVFVDGCFWHGCPEHCSAPKANRAWWAEKLAGNRRRDAETDVLLRASGWTVLRFWAHEDATSCAEAVRAAVRGLGAQTGDGYQR